MPFYTARVELQGTAAEAYQNLHIRMEEAGFYRAGAAPTGTALRETAAPAEYGCESERDLDGIFEAARTAAAAAASAFTILVCESRTQKWIGLRVSKPA